MEVEGSGRFTYKWYDINDEMNPVNADATTVVAAKSHTYAPTAAGTYYCVITSTDDNTGVQTQAVTLTVSEAPAFNSITPASATICEGGSVTLGVDATGSALTYQWYQQAGATPAPDTDDKKGTAPTYTPVGLTTTATFYCVVGSGSVCTATVISDPVAVTIESAPKITTQPLSQSVCGSTGVTLNVVAVNTDTYQWYYNGTTTGGNSATLANVKAGGVYTCVVSKSGGVCGEATSVPALITVAAEPKVNLGTRNNLTACQGDLITLPSPEVETGGSVIVTEKTGWYLSTEADPEAATLVASFAAGNADVTYHYKLTYQCSEGAGTETLLTTAEGMPTLTVTVNTPITITTHPKEDVKCGADAFSNLSVTATGTAPSWQWYKDNATQSGATGSSYAVGQNAGVYHCVVSNVCGSATSAPATLIRNTALAATAYADKSALCGSEATIVGVKVTAGTAVSYQWYKAGTVINGATSSTMAVVGEDGTGAVSRMYNCTVTDVCGKTVKPNVTVTHNPVPKITAQPVGGDVCNATKALGVTATGAKSSGGYQWYKNGGSIGGATSASYTAPNTLGTNTYYCVVTSDQCGSVTSNPAVVTVAKAPTTSLLSSAYWAIHGSPVPVIAAPRISDNGCTLSGDKLVYGSGKNDLSSNFSLTMDYQPVYYRISYSGICSGTSDIALGTLRGKVYDTDAVSGVVPDDGKMHIMIDTRDNKEYNIKKIKGGQVWMVQNLDYGICSGAYNEANSKGNVQGITGINGLMYGVCRSSADYSSAPKDGGKTYKYYNWQGAMQRSDTYYGSSAAPSGTIQGICPNGWHLPTKDEMQTMYNNVGSYANLISTADNNTSSWAGVFGGLVYSSGSFEDGNRYGYYWSSSYHDTTWAYGLYFISGGNVYPKDNNVKYLGFAVRCLKN